MDNTRFQMPIPSPVNTALQMLEQAGFEAYLVGGCVRDALLGEAAEDYDIATSALPEQTLAVFERHCRVITDGMRHGTVAPIIEHKPMEITTFRTDGAYSDGRHPDKVQFRACLREDLARRDFTVNAMAYSEKTGLIDLFGGEEDLKNGIIRTVGEADKRFGEDALRILRALRFSAVLGFDIEPATAESIRHNMPRILHVSAERIYTELKKLLGGDYADKALVPYPCLLETLFEIRLTPEKQAAMERNHGFAYRLALVFQGENLQKLQRLKPDNKTAAFVRELLQVYALPFGEEAADCRKTAAFIYQNGIRPEIFEYLLLMHADLDKTFCYADAFESYLLAQELELPFSPAQLAIGGEALKREGFAGKAIAQALDRLAQAVIAGVCANEEQALLELAKTYRKEQTTE